MTERERRRAEKLLTEGFEREHWQATGLLLVADLLGEIVDRLDAAGVTPR